MTLTSFYSDWLHLCLKGCPCPPLISEVSHLLLIQFVFVVSSYSSCIYRRMHCLFDVLLLLSFFLLWLGCLMVLQTQSFWTFTLLKYLFKIISVWLCHQSVTKYSLLWQVHYFSIWVQFAILLANYCILCS